MENFRNRVKQLRESKNITQKELSELLGMKTYTTITKWESGDNFPKAKDIKRLSEIFDVSSDYLLGLSNETGSKISRISSKLNEPRQKIVLNTATVQLDEQNNENKKKSNIIPINRIPENLPPYISRKILENFVMPENTMEYESDEDMIDVPILGRIAAGLPLDAIENFDGTRPVPSHFLSSARNYYWLMVEGHSMEPKIPFGSYVLIESVPDVTDGTIGAVLFQEDTQATLKKVYHEVDKLRLVSINKEFKDQFATEERPAAVIGQAVKVEIDL